MPELLWLLLPVAAASGWVIGYAQRRSGRKPNGRRFVPDYFAGLNFLLNEQQDRALEVFMRLVQDDSETVETHLALGNLFRRRGEVDKAIRIHQNLIARPTLTKQQRATALMELARDYLRAGVLDRAEGLFKDLQQTRSHAEEALRSLLAIYEQEREWESAIATARRLEQTTGRPAGEVIAHYYCELSEQADERGDDRRAASLLRKALEADRSHVRACILAAAKKHQQGRYRQAIRYYREVQAKDPDYTPEVIEPLVQCLEESGDPVQIDAFIKEIEDQFNSFTVIKTVTELVRRRQGDAAAEAFFRQQVLSRPSLRALREWVHMEWERTDGRRREGIHAILDMLDRLLASKPVYRCRQCGFNGKSLHWQCPSCHAWNTVKPVIGIEGE